MNLKAAAFNLLLWVLIVIYTLSGFIVFALDGVCRRLTGKSFLGFYPLERK